MKPGDRTRGTARCRGPCHAAGSRVAASL